MVLYPTEEWLVEYQRRINEHDGFDVAGRWGEDFTGDFLFVITDVPLDETTLSDLPQEAFGGLPTHVRRSLAPFALDTAVTPFVRPLFTSLGCVGSPLSLAGAATLVRGELRGFLPERTADLLRQVDEHVVDDTIYAFVSITDGNCTEIGLLGGPDERTADFVLRGPNSAWGKVIDGDLDVFSAVSDGELEIGGDGGMERLVEYADTMELLGEAAANVETTRLF